MPRAQTDQRKVQILKKTTGFCPSRSYYYYMRAGGGGAWAHALPRTLQPWQQHGTADCRVQMRLWGRQETFSSFC